MPNNEPLNLFIINTFKEGSVKNKTVFEVYYPLDKPNLIKLNLKICENIVYNEIINCSTYSIESIHEDSCISCGEGFYPIYNKELNQNQFKKCYSHLEGYFLSKKDSAFKECYHNCKSCNKEGNDDLHNCLECNSDYAYEMVFNESSNVNCYDYCLVNFYDININKFYCLEKPKCFKGEKYILDNKQCISDCKNDTIYKYEFKNICYKECPKGSKQSDDKNNPYYCNAICTKDYPYEHIPTQQCIQNCSLVDMLRKICKINFKDNNSTQNTKLSSKIIQDILSGNLGPLLSQILEGNETFILEDENDAHFISTIGSQLSEVDYSSVNFGECEKFLRNKTGIKDDEGLIMYKIEHYVEGFNIPIIEYVLFNQNGSIQLNLSLCDNMNIQYKIPVSINENELEKYNPDSEFYNDECTNYKTEDGVDMTLYDRKNEFNKNNMSLCEKGCTYKNYNPDTQQVECDCNIKSDLDYSNENIDQKELLNQIEVEKSNSNLKITKCMNVFSSPEQLQTNSGFYILILILIIFIIVFILFCTKGKRMLEEKADEVINKKFKNKKHVNLKSIFKKSNKNNKNNKINNKSIKQNNNKNKKINNKIQPKKKSNPVIKKSQGIKLNPNSQANSKNIILSKNTNFKLNKNNFGRNKDHNNIKKIGTMITNNKNFKQIMEEDVPDKDNDYELNISSYTMAVKYDKRSCCQYYSSLLKNKQIFMFTFCSFNDYNSGIIKKFIFFLSFALHYTVSALFFNEDTFHQIYEDGGSFNFMFQLPKILFSALFSTVFLRIMLETLVLTERNILQIKQQKTYNEAIMMKKKALKCIKIKFA